MADQIANPRLQARVAGFLYLIVVVASVFALMTTSRMIVSDDAAATAANILAAELMFRLSFSANLVACAAYIAVVAILYELFRPVSRTLSVVAAFFGLAGCAVSGASMISGLAPLYFLGDAEYLRAFQPEQLQALARTALRFGALGNSIALVFFGFYCLSLGCLVLGARFLPRFLGVLLLIAGAGWLVGSFSSFLAPSLALSRYLLPVSGIGELLFTLWLLVMGVNAEKWTRQADAA